MGHARTLYLNHSPMDLVDFDLVESVRRAHDTRPRPNGQDLLAGTVLNRRDGKDFLSTRLAYRRLDTS